MQVLALQQQANDATLRGLNYGIVGPARGNMAENFDMMKMSPFAGQDVDEAAANRRQDRYFHLEDETMMSFQIMGLTMNAKSEWLLQEPDGIPLQAVTSLKWIKRIYVFDQSRWEVSPEEGPDRTKQSYSR